MTRGATSAADVAPDRFARWVSAVGQPAVGIPIGCLLLGWTLADARWAVATMLAASAPIIGVLLLRATRVVERLRITGRRRLLLLSGGAAWEVIAVTGLTLLGAPAPLRAALVGLLGGVATLILLHPTGVSAHTSVFALFAGTLMVGEPLLGTVVACAGALAGWSRWRLGAHTLVQVAVCPPAVGAVTVAVTLATR